MTDDLGPLLIESIEAIHRENTRRPIHCSGCDLTFMKAAAYFEHRSRHNHPSTRRKP